MRPYHFVDAGRAVPRCGYQAQDMIDDDIGELSKVINYPSVEGFFTALENFPARSVPI